jgi:hypothetical protein
MDTTIGRLGVFGSALALAFACVGCGNDEEAREPSSVVVTSNSALYEGTFSASPALGHNAIRLELADANGGWVEQAKIAGEALCPEHGHGSGDTPMASEHGHGSYLIDNVVFTMPGTWDVHVYVSTPAGDDELVVSYDVE